jgi:hypothetical protein
MTKKKKARHSGKNYHLFSFHYILIIWYDMGCIGNTVSNSSFIVAFALISVGVYRAVAQQQYRRAIQTTKRSHKPPYCLKIRKVD